jgi:hypothetical protein
MGSVNLSLVNLLDDHLSGSPSSDTVDIVDALDQYAKQLWGTKLPIAAGSDPSIVRLVWLTAGVSVAVARTAGGDYVCGLQPVQIARRAHLSSTETGHALQVLVDGGRLQPLRSCTGDGYRLRLDRGRERVLKSAGRR